MPVDNDGGADKLVRLFKQDHYQQVDDFGEVIPEDSNQRWVDTPLFNLFIGAVIAANAVTIGMETSEQANTGKSSVLWLLLEFGFCLIFIVELSARLYFHRWGFFGTLGDTRRVGEVFEFTRLNVGNIFDFIVVVIAVIDTFILLPIGMGGSARFLSFLRFVRLVRLIRLIRLFRIFKELWLVASGLLDALKTLFWVSGLLAIFIEVCAIVTTRVVGHNDELYDPYFKTSGGWDHEIYFKTVLRSMLTLVQIMTLDSWSDDIVRHIGKQQPGMIAFFVAFIAITNLSVLNVVVGIVIESTMQTSKKDQTNARKIKERQRQMVFNQLRSIFEIADVDGSGTLTLEEVLDATNTPEVYNKLKMIDFPADNPEEIFNLLDYDGSGALTIEEFISGCIRMKGQAKSKDLLVAQVALNTLRDHFVVFENEVAKFNKKVKHLDKTARSLLGHGEHIFLNNREYRMRHPEMKDQAILPRMQTKDLVEAPWLQERTEDKPGNAAIADRGAATSPGALTNGSSAHALDIYQGNRPSPESPPLSPAVGMLADRTPERPAPPPMPARMLQDGSRAVGMLSNSAANGQGDELAIVQVPGAMPLEDDRNTNAR